MEFVRRHWIGLLAAIVALTALLILYWIARSTGAPTFDYEIR